ncbi:MAG: TadE/TadG family type IV pilus assembly protein [Pseudomonadota bacterium]
MIKQIGCRARGRQKGLAAVEMLITVPILVAILLAITEFGHAFIQYNTINKMAQNGVRHATADILGTGSTVPCNNATTVSDTINVVLYGRTSAANATPVMEGVTAEDVTMSCAGKYVTITVNHQYTPIIEALSSNTSFDVPLIASAVMRTEP